MTHARWIRIALGYLTLQSITLGVWATLAPRNFYDSFPGAGRAWISVDGPYNEHLVRDVGALNLALTLVLVWAIVRLSREVVLVASAASIAWGVPHLLYHLTATDGLETSDIVASLGGLALFAALPFVVIVVARNHLTD